MILLQCYLQHQCEDTDLKCTAGHLPPLSSSFSLSFLSLFQLSFISLFLFLILPFPSSSSSLSSLPPCSFHSLLILLLLHPPPPPCTYRTVNPFLSGLFFCFFYFVLSHLTLLFLSNFVCFSLCFQSFRILR